MKFVFALAVLFVSACSVPFIGSDTDEEKAECDRIAAQAIQTEDVEDAKNFSARASECYALIQAS